MLYVIGSGDNDRSFSYFWLSS